jgi:hypothetical protein
MSYQSRLSEARSGYSAEGNTFNARMEEYGQINEHIDNLNNLAQQKDNFDITHPLEAGGSIEGSLIALKGLQHATLGTAEKPKFLGRVLNKLGENFDKSKLNLLNNNKRDGWAKNLKSTAEDLRGKAKDIRFKQTFRQGQKRAGGTQEGEELGEGSDFLGKGQTQQEQQNQAIDELRSKMREQSGYRDDEGGVDGLFSGERGGSYRGDDTREGDPDDARQAFKYDPDEAELNRVNTATEGVANENFGVVGDFDKTIGLKPKTKPWMRAQPARDRNPADFEADPSTTPEIAEARQSLGLNKATVLKSTRETGGMGGEDTDAIGTEVKVVNLGADTDALSGSVNSGGGGVGTSVKIFKTTGGRAGWKPTVGSETTGEAEEASNMGEQVSARVGGFASRQVSNVRNIGQSLVEEGGRLKQNLGDFVGRQKASFNQGMTRGTGAVDDATEGAGEAAGDAVADLGTTAGSEIGAGTLDAVAGGLEVAGAGLDATGIGAGAGLVVGAVGLAAGAYGAYESGKGVYEFIKQDLLHKADNTMTSLAKPMVSLAQKGLGVVPTFDTSHTITQTSNSW